MIKHTFRLTGFFFQQWRILLLCGPILALIQLGYTWIVSADAASAYVAFESVTERAVFRPLFFFLMVAIPAFAALRLRMFFWRRPCAGYTLLTLPGPRAAIPLGALIALMLLLALTAVMQAMSLLGCAFLWDQHAGLAIQNALPFFEANAAAADATLQAADLPVPARSCNLFLAMLRAPIGRLLFPVSLGAVPALLLCGLTLCLLAVQISGIKPTWGARLLAALEAFLLCVFILSCISACTPYDGSFRAANAGILVLLAGIDAALFVYTLHQYRNAGMLP